MNTGSSSTASLLNHFQLQLFWYVMFCSTQYGAAPVFSLASKPQVMVPRPISLLSAMTESPRFLRLICSNHTINALLLDP